MICSSSFVGVVLVVNENLFFGGIKEERRKGKGEKEKRRVGKFSAFEGEVVLPYVFNLYL
jgi:hypothetical protein